MFSSLSIILLPAALLALIGGTVHLDNKNIGYTLLGRAIFIGPLMGVLTGLLFKSDVYSFIECVRVGYLTGIIFELVWLNKFPIGVEIQPEGSLAASAAVPLTLFIGDYINTKAGLQGVDTLSVLPLVLMTCAPLAYVSQSLYRLHRKINGISVSRLITDMKGALPHFERYNFFGLVRMAGISAGTLFICIIVYYLIAIILYEFIPPVLRDYLLHGIHFVSRFLPFMCLIFYLNAINFHTRIVFFLGGMLCGFIEFFLIIRGSPAGTTIWHLILLMGLSICIGFSVSYFQKKTKGGNHAKETT